MSTSWTWQLGPASSSLLLTRWERGGLPSARPRWRIPDVAPGACPGPSAGLSLCPELVAAALTAIVVSELPVCVCAQCSSLP